MKKYGKDLPTQEETQASIISPIIQALTKSKITLQSTCERLKQSMDAKETKVFNDSGKLIYSDALIAHGIRLKATVEALKLQQAYPAEKHDLNIMGDTEMSLAVTVYRRELENRPPDKPRKRITKAKEE